MTVTDFTTLSLSEQTEILYAEGVFLAKRKTFGEFSLLFQLNQLYIEITYQRYRSIVRCIRCSGNPDMATPYLESICITGILP